MIGKTIGQYQVIDKIGEGGMGAVYKAEDTTLHRLVALKTLSGHLTEDEEAQERFIREAQSASSLNHPNITTVHEFIEDDDTRLICMEYVEGKTIRDMVESGIVSVRKAIDIITQTAEALEAAHNKGILHRDVKSANIMVNMEGRVKVMDFGLAQLAGKSQLTRTGTTMGTLSYSSPEQISGRTVDKRSEIFSLGVVFYELLTGKLPFAATNEAEILFAIINNEPPKPSTVRDDVPELVEVVLTRMLEKNPDQRYQNCGEVISDLTGIRKEMETSTVSLTETLKRLPTNQRKSQIRVAGVTTLVMVVLATGAILLWPNKSDLDPGKAVVAKFLNAQGDESISQLAMLPVPWITQGLETSGLLRVEQVSTALDLSNNIERSQIQSRESVIDLLARGAGAGIVISGTYWKQDDQLYFQAEISNAIKDAQLGVTEVVSGPDSNPDALMEILLQRVLGLVASHLDPNWGQIASMTTRPPSLEVFLEGQTAGDLFLKGDLRGALQHSLTAWKMNDTYWTALYGAISATHNLGLRNTLEGSLYWYTRCDSLISIAEGFRGEIDLYTQQIIDYFRCWLFQDREGAYRIAKEMSDQTPFHYYSVGLDARNFNFPDEAASYLKRIDLELPWLKDWSANWDVHWAALFMLGRHREAVKVVQRAQVMHPDDPFYLVYEARSLAAMGKLRPLKKLIDSSMSLIPRSTWTPAGMMRETAEVLMCHGNEEFALDLLDRSIAWYTEHEDQRGSSGHAESLYIQGRLEEAQQIYRTLSNTNPRTLEYLGYLGIIAARLDQSADAMIISEQIEGMKTKYRKGNQTYWQGLIAAHMGETDRALALLRRAFLEGQTYSAYLHYSSTLEPLRENPQFQELIRPKG